MKVGNYIQRKGEGLEMQLLDSPMDIRLSNNNNNINNNKNLNIWGFFLVMSKEKSEMCMQQSA